MDAIIWKQRGKHGEKATVGIIDDKSNYIWHFEMVKRSDATQSFIDTVLAARADPEFGRPDLISIVRTDNAGEWGRDNADFHRRVKEGLAPHVPKFEYLGTMIDSRYNASDQPRPKQPKLTVSSERDSLDRTSLTHITRTHSFAFSGKPDDQWLPGFNASHESASPHKEPPVTQNPPRRASGVSPGYCEANPRSAAWYRPSLRTLCA